MEDCQKQIHQVEFLNINEVSITEKERIRTTSGQNVEDLKESIRDLGLFHPILVNHDHKLISGYRRLKACKQLGWDIIPAFIKRDISEIDEINIELHENIRRKNLSPYEIDIALAKMKKFYEKLHPETVHLARNKLNKKGKQGKKSNKAQERRFSPNINESMENFNQKNGNAKRFTQVAAEFSNYSERTIRDRIQVGASILKQKYDVSTIKLYKRGRITHSEMLLKDRMRRRIENAFKLRKENQWKKKKMTSGPQHSVITWCKDCKKAIISFCPECGKQVITCNKGYIILKKLDSTKCKDYTD